jgi:hypothetical protein
VATAVRDEADRQALALELRQAAAVAAPVRRALAALTTAMLVEAAKAAAASAAGQLSPQAQARIRALFDAELAALLIDVTAATTKAVGAAVRLAIRQETPVLRTLGYPEPVAAAVTSRVLADPLLAGAGRAATANLAAKVAKAREYGRTAPLATPKDVKQLAGAASSAVAVVERDVRTATNRAINTTARQIVLDAPAPARVPALPVMLPSLEAPPRISVPAILEPPTAIPAEPAPQPVRLTAEPTVLIPPGLRVVWVAERGACLTCLALSGHVIDPNSGTGFDEFATFSPHGAPQVWPPGMPLMAPPRHPHCRCRLRIIAADNTMLPEALRREAQRSVARGWSDHDSRKSRLTAADRLMARGAPLPRTVQERARVDVARGSFSTRHRPRVPALRND